MTDWTKAEASSSPSEFDTTSSETTVYQRRSITKETREAPDGSASVVYVYEERKLTRADYAELLAKQNSDAIDELVLSQLGGI